MLLKRNLMASLSFLSVLFFAIEAQALPHDSGAAAFLDESFHMTYQRQFVWLTGEKKGVSNKILGHNYSQIRIPYWQSNRANHSRSAKTVWILNEIGKDKPITIGVIIQNEKIQSVRIIKFRESRGWEVKLPSFINQFTGIYLNSGQHLSQNIDGISGATLSVRAVTKIARLALYLQSTLPNP